jgi:hypothetical protein
MLVTVHRTTSLWWPVTCAVLYSVDDGHHNGRFRIHAGVRRLVMGAVHIFPASAVLGQPQSVVPHGGVRGHLCAAHGGALDFPERELTKGRVPI